MVNGLHVFSAFPTSESALQHLAIHTHTHSHTNVVSAVQGNSQLFMVGCLAERHLDTQLGGDRAQTSNLSVTSLAALPPEPHANLIWVCV